MFVKYGNGTASKYSQNEVSSVYIYENECDGLEKQLQRRDALHTSGLLGHFISFNIGLPPACTQWS